MKSLLFRKLWACLALALTLSLAVFGCAQDENLPINTANSRKITVEFPTDIVGEEKILKNAALMSKHLDSCSLIQLETGPECVSYPFLRAILSAPNTASRSICQTLTIQRLKTV